MGHESGAGQGKSFVEKLIAYLLLATHSTTKVHLVYNNEHLLNRDKKTFEELIMLASLEEESL